MRTCAGVRVGETHALYEVQRGALVVRGRDEPARAILPPRREELARRSVVAEPGACAHGACQCALHRRPRQARVRKVPGDGPRKTTFASVELCRGPPFGPSGHAFPTPVKSRLTTLLLIACASVAS